MNFTENPKGSGISNIIDAHGGNIYKESQKYGIIKEEILDYSANINPLGLPCSIRDMILSSIDSLVNYPDPRCTRLRMEVSTYVGVNTENIIVGNGASEVIFLLMEVLRPGKVLIPAPTFSEYANAAENFGAGIVYFERKEEKGYVLDINKLMEQMQDDIQAVILCNPNNPTSTLIRKDDLLEFIRCCEKKGVFVIVDEAFIELTDGANSNSVADKLSDFNNLFIIRAFTKLFAIPGLRLGYGLGPEYIIKKMWDRKLPWSVNTFASSIGKVLTDREYLGRTAKWLSAEKQWFYSELQKVQGLKVFKPETNFILIKIIVEDMDAAKLKDKLLSRGILIRNASSFVFLDNSFFRLAIKDRESNKKLLIELEAALKEG